MNATAMGIKYAEKNNSKIQAPIISRKIATDNKRCVWVIMIGLLESDVLWLNRQTLLAQHQVYLKQETE